MVRVPPEARQMASSGAVPRRQRHRDREAAIVTAAGTLARGDLLALRMADVAEAAGISIGSLYRHFESKEDLLAGLACRVWRERLVGLGAVLAADGDAAERLLAGVIGDVRRLAEPEVFAILELGTSRAIGQGAAVRRVEELAGLQRRISEEIGAAAREAVTTRAFLPWRDVEAQVRAIAGAAWTLMAGAWHGGERASASSLPPYFADVCAATFAGLGWRDPYPTAAVERIAEVAAEPAG